MHAQGAPVVVVGGIPYAANLAFDGAGRLWVASATFGPAPSEGVWYLPPGGHPQHVVSGLTAPSALTWVGDRLYVASFDAKGDGQITLFEGFDGSAFHDHRTIADGLKTGSHAIGTILPDSQATLLVGLGAASNEKSSPGRVVSIPAGGGSPSTQATGLRTAFGLARWNGRIVVTNSGPDKLLRPPDALYAFTPGQQVEDFGFPACYGQGGVACAGTPAPLTLFPAHSTPSGIAVRGDVAFVADNGSSVPKVPEPSAIIRVDLKTGAKTVFWRSPVPHDLVGVAIGPEGDLYASEFASGRVVRFNL